MAYDECPDGLGGARRLWRVGLFGRRSLRLARWDGRCLWRCLSLCARGGPVGRESLGKLVALWEVDFRDLRWPLRYTYIIYIIYIAYIAYIWICMYVLISLYIYIKNEYVDVSCSRGLAWIFFRVARALKLLRVQDFEKGIDALEHAQQTAYNLQESEGPNSWRLLWLEWERELTLRAAKGELLFHLLSSRRLGSPALRVWDALFDSSPEDLDGTTCHRLRPCGPSWAGKVSTVAL